MTKSLYQWAYLLFLVALQLCTIFGDVGVDVSTACDDHLDCGTTIGSPGTIGGDSDHNFKVKLEALLLETIHLAPPITAGSNSAHDGDDVLHNIDDTNHPLAPTVNTPMSPLDEARHAPAPAMDPSLFEVNDKIPSFPPSHPLPPGMDPSLFDPDEARQYPSPFVDAPLHTVDDLNGKSHPLRTAMGPFLIAVGEVPHFLSAAADPPLFLSDELLHAAAPEIDPSLFTDLDDESRPLAPPMDPSLFSLSQGHHASAAAMNPPSFSFEEARHALVPAMALSPFRYDEESCVNTAPQRKLRGAAMKDLTDGTILAQAQGAVAADEPFELEAFIVASRRKFVEAKLRREEDGYEGNFIARSILEVFEDVAVYVEDLLAEILPGWLHPTSGLIERAEECFHDADFVAVRPDWDPRNSHSDGLYGRDDVDNGRYEGNGWLFCVPTNRLVQHDPTLVYPENAVTGHRAATSLPPSQTKHNYDEREDNYHDHSPVDAIVAADYALYVAEQTQLTQLARYAPLESYLPAAVAARLARHTAELADERSALETVFERFLARDKQEEEVRLRQVALYAPLESYLPAAVTARLARHIAELADERSALETVLERFFVRDKQEEERVAMETHELETRTIETHIMTQMQNLLSGGSGGGKQLEEEEEALAPVCHAIECYAFVPTNVTTTECDALVDVLWAPPIDECTPPEVLQGNDHHASSQSDCHLYLPPVSFCYAPVSIESNASSYNAKTSLSDTPGFHCNMPQLDRQPTAEDILFTFLGDIWATTNRRLQGLSASGALLVVGCVVALLGVLCTVGELTGPREDELRMTESELQRIIAVAVAEGVKDRGEMLGKALLRKLDLLCMPGGALQAALEETSGLKEAADDAEEKDATDHDVESKQEEKSASMSGKESMAGGALQAAPEEPSGKQEAGDDAEEKDDKARDVESKQEEVSVSSRGRKKKTHRAGRKHRNGRKKPEDGLGEGGGGGGAGGGREEAKGEGGGDLAEV